MGSSASWHLQPRQGDHHGRELPGAPLCQLRQHQVPQRAGERSKRSQAMIQPLDAQYFQRSGGGAITDASEQQRLRATLHPAQRTPSPTPSSSGPDASVPEMRGARMQLAPNRKSHCWQAQDCDLRSLCAALPFARVPCRWSTGFITCTH